MNTAHAGMGWQGALQPLLDEYLRKIGVQSVDARTRWVAHVMAGLHLHPGEFAEDDILEKAVEYLRDAIDARLALYARLDRVHDRRTLAAALAVLHNEKYADLVNMLFENFAGAGNPELPDKLRDAIASDRPRPVPPNAPLAMPEQAIELRPLRRALRKAE